MEYLELKHLLALPVLGLVLGTGVGTYKHFSHPVKHTQRCQFINRVGTSCDWFIRPNGEFFETCWDNPPKVFGPGMQFKDITYKDDNADLRHFIKAELSR